MASFNKITILGFLGRDPELRYTPQGTAVCNVSVATTERRKDRAGDYQDTTTWFRVTFWGRLAEVASQYLKKGKQVYIEGRLSQTEYQDRDGTTRTSLDVQGSELQFIGGRDDENAPAESSKQASNEEAPAVTDDDIPF